jgi:hypothetical protein
MKDEIGHAQRNDSGPYPSPAYPPDADRRQIELLLGVWVNPEFRPHDHESRLGVFALDFVDGLLRSQLRRAQYWEERGLRTLSL